MTLRDLMRCIVSLSFGIGLNPSVGATEPPQRLVHGLLWDAHEVTVGQVAAYARASGFVSQSEKDGGGFVFESGWVQKRGWTWRKPFGVDAAENEPAVHLTFDEALGVCRHAGKRLPNDTEWVKAAFLEQRQPVPAAWVAGKRYAFPNGDSSAGSNYLNSAIAAKGVAPKGVLMRGTGHVPVMQTPAGVNGLWDMGGNVWEWVDSGAGQERVTRGASWWYGPERQREEDLATKPRDTRVVYIGFRCVQTPAN
jgi:formylglycine-generating enzyme required for sulfatase activity